MSMDDPLSISSASNGFEHAFTNSSEGTFETYCVIKVRAKGSSSTIRQVKFMM
jgi:hypothetical protein